MELSTVQRSRFVLKDPVTTPIYLVTGTRLLIRWDLDDVQETGWKAGWYAAEVVATNMAAKTVEVVYKSEEHQTYSVDLLQHLKQCILRLASVNVPDTYVFVTIVEVGTVVEHKCTNETVGTKRTAGR